MTQNLLPQTLSKTLNDLYRWIYLVIQAPKS